MGSVVLDEDVLPIYPKILKLIDTRVCVTRHWKFDGPEDLVRIRERFTRPTKQPQVHPDQTKLQFLWRRFDSPLARGKSFKTVDTLRDNGLAKKKN
jgi:hypothetical protein